MEPVSRILMLWDLFVKRWDAYEKLGQYSALSTGPAYDAACSQFNNADAEFMGHFNAWLADRKAAQDEKNPPWGTEETA